MDEARPAQGPGQQISESDRFWQFFMHEDNLLATRVSFFLPAESILIAVAASLINTIAGLSHSSYAALRDEIFGLILTINLAGLALTLVFWYVFRLNFDNIGVYIEELKDNPIHVKVSKKRAERKRAHRYSNLVFRKRDINWLVANTLPAGLFFLWCVWESFQ